MAAKGYIRENQNANTLQQNLQRLRRAGIPLSAITVGGDIMQVIDSMKCGDSLVTISVSELSPQPARQKLLLARIADSGITFRPLDKAGADSEIQREGRLRGWLRRMGFVRAVPESPSTPPMSEELKTKAIRSLTDYYQMKKSVEAVCNKGGIGVSTLYQFLREHDLPSRRMVQVMPLLNPLQDPEFLDKIQRGVLHKDQNLQTETNSHGQNR